MTGGTAHWNFGARVVVITNTHLARGGAQARAFADAGATVIACDANMDLTNEGAVSDLARRIDGEHGRLDALVVNDAGAPESQLLDVSVEDWQMLVKKSLTAPFLCAKHLIP